MTAEFTIDLIEQKKDLLFVAGIALTDLDLNTTFSAIIRYGATQKSGQQLATVDLTVETIIVAGEPMDSVAANTPAMMALTGDSTALFEQARALRWRKKSDRLIRSSDAALTLSST